MGHFQTNHRRVLVAGSLMLIVTVCFGCRPYQIEGLVVIGGVSEVTVVAEGDPRLRARGIEGASVELTVDPKSMRPRRLAAVMTDRDGRFVMPIDELGAGFLEYKLAVRCSIDGYQTAYQTLKLPSRSKSLLITIAAGRDTFQPKTDILRETMDEADGLLNR